MGKLTLTGLKPPDDPMFTGGPEVFSRPGSNPPSAPSARATSGAPPEEPQETESDGLRAEALRRLKVRRLLPVEPGPPLASSHAPSDATAPTGSVSSGKTSKPK
jgi:hypothetical protein